jgi:hypothetical protein
MSVRIGASAIEDLVDLLRKHLRKEIVAEGTRLGLAGRVFGSIAVLVGDDEVQMPAEREPSIALQHADGRKIVRLDAEPVLVELSDRRFVHVRRDELLQRFSAALHDARGLVFEPRLHREDFARLPRLGLATEALEALPSEP